MWCKGQPIHSLIYLLLECWYYSELRLTMLRKSWNVVQGPANSFINLFAAGMLILFWTADRHIIQVYRDKSVQCILLLMLSAMTPSLILDVETSTLLTLFCLLRATLEVLPWVLFALVSWMRMQIILSWREALSPQVTQEAKVGGRPSLPSLSNSCWMGWIDSPTLQTNKISYQNQIFVVRQANVHSKSGCGIQGCEFRSRCCGIWKSLPWQYWVTDLDWGRYDEWISHPVIAR